LRSALTIVGIALAVATTVALVSFHQACGNHRSTPIAAMG